MNPDGFTIEHQGKEKGLAICFSQITSPFDFLNNFYLKLLSDFLGNTSSGRSLTHTILIQNTDAIANASPHLCLYFRVIDCHSLITYYLADLHSSLFLFWYNSLYPIDRLLICNSANAYIQCRGIVVSSPALQQV